MEVLDLTALDETPISLAEASAILPKRNGKRISIRSIERWIRYGHRGVFLAAAKVAGSFFTTREAIQRFNVACMSDDRARHKVPDAASERTTAATSKPPAKSRSQRELERAGWAGRKAKTRNQRRARPASASA